MSNWTHVAAIIRIDGLRGMLPVTFQEKIDPLPEGSEGPLDIHVWENPMQNHLAAFTVSLFGDLRDHDGPDDILSWLNKLTDDEMIRQGIAHIENEWNGAWTYQYQKNESSPGGCWNLVAGKPRTEP